MVSAGRAGQRLLMGPWGHAVNTTRTIGAHVATSAADTDVTAKLLDVHPGGFAQRLCDGIVRLRYRDGFDAERPVTPGDTYEVEIRMWDTCVRLPSGHRLRVEIASSAFPKYDVNLGTGGDADHRDRRVIATNRLWHTPSRPSRLIELTGEPLLPGTGPPSRPGRGRSPAGRDPDQPGRKIAMSRRSPSPCRRQVEQHPGGLAGLAVPVAVEKPVRLARDFPLGAQAGVGEVAIGVAHHPLGTVVAVLDGDVYRHVRCLPHELSVSQHPCRHNGPQVALSPKASATAQASATASSPPSNRISGTSVRRSPP